MRQYAKKLAKLGYAAYCFDFCGGCVIKGKSDGKTTEMSVLTEVKDLEAVIQYAKSMPYCDAGRIVLMGCSQGGLVSALVAARRPQDISGLILWYPAFSIPEDAQRRYMAGENQVFGIVLGKAFDEQARKIDVYGSIAAYPGPVLLIHGTEDSVVPLSCSERALSYCSDGQLIKMEGAGHGYEGTQCAAAREHSIAFVKTCCG